jgi:cytochrome P450
VPAVFEFDPYAPSIDADPFPHYRILRDQYPCFWSEQARMWILSRYADIFAALRDWKTFSSASGNLMDELPDRAGATLGTTDPPRHDRLRALISHAFMKRSLDALEQPIRALTRAALDELADRRSFDFIEDFSSRVTTNILFRLLGLPPADDRLVRSKAVLMVQTDAQSRRKGETHIAAYRWMQEYATAIIAERRRTPSEDLLSHFVLAEIEGQRLEEREILLTTTTLIMAGVESLGGFTAMFALNLADMPQVRAELVANPNLVSDAIEESLRYNTSAQRFRRRAMRDVELHGHTIRRDDFVCLAYGSGNRDERQFPDPDRFDISRKPKGHLGFGGGVHGCLGSMLARASLRIIFEEFLARLPHFRRTDDTLEWMPSTTFRSPVRLQLAIE